MSNYKKITGITFLLALLSWILAFFLTSSTPKVWTALFAIAISIAFLCFLTITVLKKFRPGLSPYRIFALTDIVIGLCVFGYALYDIATDTGWFAGLAGMLLLIFVLPINLLLLLIDFLIWKKKNSKKTKN